MLLFLTNNIARLFFIFALFPFVSFGTNGMDSQPHYIFLAFLAFILFAFNGLVTFQNLNDELADGTSGSEITTINGARIQTGTLDVSQVNISGTTQSNFNLQSAGSGSRMKITNDTIEIYDGSVLRVKLGNLS